jgi:hypothetical protein
MRFEKDHPLAARIMLVATAILVGAVAVATYAWLSDPRRMATMGDYHSAAGELRVEPVEPEEPTPPGARPAPAGAVAPEPTPPSEPKPAAAEEAPAPSEDKPGAP